MIYQDVIDTYCHPNANTGRVLLQRVINKPASVPPVFKKPRRLGRTFQHRKDDMLAYFTHRNTSNGLTEAVNGRLEHLRGGALGLRNLANYMMRTLLGCGGFRACLKCY